MIIEYTEKEQKEIKAIEARYKAELKRLSIEYKENAQNGDKEKERLEALVKIQALHDSMEMELGAYTHNCQGKRFKKISEKGAEAVRENAREQVPELIKILYDNTVSSLGEKVPSEDLEALKDIVTYSNDKYYLKHPYIMEMLKSELSWHIDYFVNDPEALRELNQLLSDLIQKSPYTHKDEATAIDNNSLKAYKRLMLPVITKYGFMNDKVNTQLLQDAKIFEQEANGQFKLLFSIDQATKKQVQTMVCLASDNDDLKLSKKLNGFDNAVYSAISNLFYHWEKQYPDKPLDISLLEIWRHMNGKQIQDGKARPSEAQLKRIKQSIDKMRHIDFTMDIRDEIDNNFLKLEDIGEKYLQGFYLKDYLLNCREVGIITNKGHEAIGYRINYEPVLHRYNAVKNHILYVPFNLLDTSDYLNDAENVTEFKQYLLQQIVLMKNKIRDNRNIRISSVYTATGVLPPEERANKEYLNEATRQKEVRRMRKQDRDKIEGLLQSWTVKEWIKGFSPVKEGNTVVSYTIHL